MSIADKLTIIAENEQKVFDAGAKSEYDRFWDVYQTSGTRTNYGTAFYGLGWTSKTFRPKYDIVPQNATQMCEGMRLSGSLKEHLNTLGIRLDTSQSTAFNQMFRNAYYITELPYIDASNCLAKNFDRVFQNCSGLVSLEIKLPNTKTTFSDTFRGMTALENLVLHGQIQDNGFNVSWSNALTHDSLMSIINALEDKTSDTSGTSWVCTLGETNLAKLTDAEKQIATGKGWTLA